MFIINTLDLITYYLYYFIKIDLYKIWISWTAWRLAQEIINNFNKSKDSNTSMQDNYNTIL